MKDIRVSEKPGLNPSLLTCPCCGADTGLALHGRLKGDEKAPKHLVDINPCEDCQANINEYKDTAIVFLVTNKGRGEAHPEEGFCGLAIVKEGALGPEVPNGIQWIDLDTAKKFGLITDEKETV